MTFEKDELLEEDFSEYTSIEEYKTKLQELKNIDLANSTLEEIEQCFEKYIKIIPSLTAFFSIENFNTFQFYRVRLNIDSDSEALNLIRTYSYPLPQFCKQNGRANLKNKSVFYCTNSPITAILESRPKVGDIGYLSIWEAKTNRMMKGGILLPKDLKNSNLWQPLTIDIHKNTFENYSKERKAEFYLETIDFVANLFLTEKEPYPFTSLASNELIYGEKWKDFIVYPSFLHDGHSSNMAIHPNIVDTFLKFKKVIRFKLLDIQNDKHTYSTGRVGEIVNTDIKWRYANDGELDFEKFPQ